MKKILAALIILLGSVSFQALSQGLKFHGLEEMISNRTSFDVFAKSPQKFRDSLEISFQMATYPAYKFGYILRIHDKLTPSHVWNLSYDARIGDSAVFRINEEGRKSIIIARIGKKDCPDYSWQEVSVKFNVIKNTVVLKIGNHAYSASCTADGNIIQPQIYFGKSEHVVDVPSFAIRKLSIGDGVKMFYFPLDESDGETVRDSNGKVRGQVSNPDWLIRESSRWNTETSIQIDSPADVFYDEGNKSVGMLTESDLKLYNLTNGTTTDKAIASACPMDILLGNNFIRDGKVYAYELSHFKGQKNDCSIACYDLAKNEWQSIGNSMMASPQHHHGAFYNPITNEYTFFGGFGESMYNGDFFVLGKDWQWHKKWEEQRSERRLFPRFFAAAGTDSENCYAYIFGGMGNESGEQIVGRRYFYDLHRVNLSTGKCDLLWEIVPQGENFVPARNLIVDGDCFYVLCYPEYLTNSTMHLYKFKIADGTYEIMADGIDVVSDKIWSSSSLYLDRDLGEFIVTSLDVDNNLKPTVSIHTLMYPPVPEKIVTGQSDRNIFIICITLLAILLVVTGAAYFVFKLTSRNKETKNYVIAKHDPGTRIFRADQRANSIFLFGQFTVFDRDENDISDTFGNQQKILLCLLLKYYDTGLSSTRMSSILWPDKEENKAKNSRGVAINSLRKSLSTLDGISIEYEEGVYRIVTKEPFYCDLLSFNSRVKASDNNGILHILCRGKFLKDIIDPAFDSFKSKIEDATSTLLSDEIAKRFKGREYRATIEIGDIIQLYDPLDEQAIHYIVHSLLAIRRRDDALVRYSAFVTEYQNTNGEPYPKRFENV